ncbi:hypothetical protein RCG17_19855 [Neobacillus sp. PS3-12]|uniref:hypothetical protein n=1 Tax=Neobacillus sp. PS3-12 TaxID=3070677 RepID=UPI0027DEC610|nr:hypothetical protein [Neobacillus sp. PS3-12]WML51671.1 hypothetical protein RCG17_19855 [Neobacillus sp. PS3-12]
MFKKFCEDDGIEVKINPDDFISFAFEANGNLTMYHKESGKFLCMLTTIYLIMSPHWITIQNIPFIKLTIATHFGIGLKL